MKEFGKCEDEDTVYINCDNEERMKNLQPLVVDISQSKNIVSCYFSKCYNYSQS